MMLKNKRGFMFTLIAIFLISIFVFVLYAQSSHVIMEKEMHTAERTEALVVNAFTKRFTDLYLDQFVAVAGASALRAMAAYVATGALDNTGGIADPEAFYRDLMMNGTVELMYDETVLSRDFAMILTARNDSEEILVAETSTGGTATFGDTTTVVQRVASPDTYGSLEQLSSITIIITNISATSDALYLVIYNETGQVVGLDYQIYDNEKEQYTFTLQGTLPFTPETYYDLMLVAPFTMSTSDYEVAISSSSSAFDCEAFSCNLAAWDLSGTSTVLTVPLDFLLDAPVIGEGFFRNLFATFVRFGKEGLQIDSEVNVTSIDIDEKDAWTIGVRANISMSTFRDTVSFQNVEGVGEADISIVGMLDPYNQLMEWDLQLPIIAQNVTEDFTVDDLYDHLSEQTFVFNENASSFLQRFAGKNAESRSCCGIQTMLNRDDISVYPKEETGYSYVDHKFTTATECTNDVINPHPLYVISNAPSGWESQYYGSSGPYYEWEDIEFYHMDEMTDLTITEAACPNEGSSE